MLGAAGGDDAAADAVQLDAAEVLLLGAVAQGVAGFATNPLDALKTRVQAGGAADVGAALKGILSADGPAGLMRGAGMRVLWIAPQGCIYYPVYEAVQQLQPRRLQRRLQLKVAALRRAGSGGSRRPASALPGLREE